MFPLLLLFLPSLDSSSSCGSLRVHPSFRLSDHSIPLLSIHASSMEECLSQCCSVAECTAVTMTGVAKESDESPSCLLATCELPGCTLMEALSQESLITITINNRTSSNVSLSSYPSLSSPPSTSSSPPLLSLSSSPPPLWLLAITLIIVFSLSVLILISLLVCCWRRKRTSIPMKNLHSMPPLHAFNPTLA
ncbi:hypothetical protein PMAYCL1PPCAC_23654 [Pristionchus mayeri]|uniref:Apple domain-containing protein n=1 Tax=Pristionchus mayeri TaxID=1317129 RepID=A0AAN5I6P0_9BILA|nr:hypothetical protein PMAYCL1PPCAC_23654 [Pristionchus mayeri]